MKQTSFIFSCILMALIVSACAETRAVPAASTTAPARKADKLILRPLSFADLPGWIEDQTAAALEPLAKSCDVAMRKEDERSFGAGAIAGTVAAWREACNNIDPLADNAEARDYFEIYFTPYEVHGSQGPEGLFTGYYQPILRGSYHRQAPYLVPLYARPASLVTADLGDFSEDLKGRKITGRVKRGKSGAQFIPFYTRREINQGALAHALKVVFVDDPVDAFFLQIQGSGLVRMEDGQLLHVGYAAQNGRPYVAIGKELIKRGALRRENVSMQSIRAWLETHPEQAVAVMNTNPSYVFFRPLPGLSAIGAQGVELTPLRSLAVDSKKIPFGVPLFVDTRAPNDQTLLRRLMIAQDTGGAITGAVRGDIFWGAGPTAADKAGRMQSKGRYFILLPRTVRVPKDKLK